MKNRDELSAGKYNALHTAGEIAGQPDLWSNIAGQVFREKLSIASFITSSLNDVDSIIFTGAGTSSYIGLSLQGLFRRKFRKNSLVIPTTDIVTYPSDYFCAETKILLISFARSGRSPESKAAVEFADRLCGKCHHLIITCDGDSILANHKTTNPRYVLVLPPEANDKGLAMTGSYSGMLLAGIMIANIFDPGQMMISQIDTLCNYGRNILDNYTLPLKQIASKNFERGIFMGSGPSYGTAAESHLKLQELTNGIIMCKRESFLGLRHGPKAVIHSNTLLCYIFSNKQYVLQYETDLVNAITRDHNPNTKIGICENPYNNNDVDLQISLSENGSHIDEVLLTVCNILPAQILGFYKSLHLGLDPDNPSANKAISRVVEGVKIYDFNNESIIYP
jgi:tagatose-6-phosphate ketose/aldose isomerase